MIFERQSLILIIRYYLIFLWKAELLHNTTFFVKISLSLYNTAWYNTKLVLDETDLKGIWQIMRKNKLKIAKIRWLLPLWVLIISAGILSFVANYVNMASYKQVRTKAKLNAVTYSDRMVDELNQGINITNSLENIILNEQWEY